MSELTRRGLLRSAGVGAAVLGVLGALPSLATAQTVSPMSMPVPPTTPGGVAAPTFSMTASQTPVVVVFDDLASGKGRVFVGEQAIEFDNSALAKSVQAIVG